MCLLERLLFFFSILFGDTFNDGSFLLLFLLVLKATLLAHNLVERVWLEVKNVGEFAEAVDLVVLERVEVEANSLQVHNEDVRSLRDHLTPLEVDLTIAAITLVVADDLSFNKFC